MLAATVRPFLQHPAVRAVVVAVPEPHLARARRLLRRAAPAVSVTVVPGGDSRQASVERALQAAPAGAGLIVVHDAVRPFVTRALIDGVLAAARVDGAAICALPVAETVKQVAGGWVETTLDRARLWAVQTPQAFQAALLREAHDKARRDGFVGTDDAMLVERLGHRVRVVPGSERNIKITTPTDLQQARAWVRP
jgi:2-C-methyl-D-erythritol 4-phosphate cytidylyltransferase